MQVSELGSEWRGWIAENLLRGVDEAAIVAEMLRGDIGAATAREIIAHVTADPLFAVASDAYRKCRKQQGLLDLCSRLYKQSPKKIPIVNRDEITASEFYERYYFLNRPVLIRGFARDWRATRKWSPEYFARQFGDVAIQITDGREADPDYDRNVYWHTATTTVAEFANRVVAGGQSNDYYLVSLNCAIENPALQPLLEDIESPAGWLDADNTRRGAVSLWFGPPGTTTPLHHDGTNVMFVQVYGRKWFKMIPSFELHHVYNQRGVYSAVDAGQPDLDAYPEYVLATPVDVTLEPSDALFIPVGWWHWVRALDVSISLSCAHFSAPDGNVVWDHSTRFA